jgi:hypothetical protein
MKDSSNIKRAPHSDSEQHLLQKDNFSDAENCLNTMKKIASLIEAVSINLSLTAPMTVHRARYLNPLSYLLGFKLILYRALLLS